MDDIMHTFNYPYTIPQALLAKKVCETIGMDKIFYQNSGTEANECMIKMARKYGTDHYGPEKYHIITAKKGFHGRTFGSMAATGQPDTAIQQGSGQCWKDFSYARYNDLNDFASKVTENTIAIMIEPVQGEGGVYPATQEFMEGLRKLCDEKGLLLLLDEVQTGWGRTGTPMAYMGYWREAGYCVYGKGHGRRNADPEPAVRLTRWHGYLQRGLMGLPMPAMQLPARQPLPLLRKFSIRI